MKNNKHSRIAIVIGTKAELVKTMPLMIELSKKKDYWFIHTGQHPLGKISEELNVKTPDFTLSKEPKISTKFWSKINNNSLIWFVSMIFMIRRKIKEINPKYVIYHGDTMSTAAASIASSKFLNPEKKWKNVHLEAGLRSGSLFEPFPEEISRQISDSFSDTLLAVSDLSESHLRSEKKSGKIINTGNTIVDAALIASNNSKKTIRKPKGEYVLINIHRHENLVNKERLRKIVNILEGTQINGIWPMHNNTWHYLKKYKLTKRVKKISNIKILPLTDYFNFIFLLANCKYLITDGGSIQEESLVFKKPCIILRNKTERQEGLKTGINFLTKLDVNYSKKIIDFIENDKIKIKNFKNPYGEKGLSKKIVEILE